MCLALSNQTLNIIFLSRSRTHRKMTTYFMQRFISDVNVFNPPCNYVRGIITDINIHIYTIVRNLMLANSIAMRNRSCKRFETICVWFKANAE